MRASATAPRLAAAKKATGTQYAALPYRVTEAGVEILLITTRRTRRWIVPKGWPIEGLTPAATAAREALEEAGISGEVDTDALGSFSYLKELRSGLSVPCRVDVFPLKVTRQRKTWAEKEAREARWLPATEAAKAVMEPGLKRLIIKFGARLAPKTH
ncbi:MAG: NUDIX hydrolase [Rhizomicrobium sp.]